MNGRRTERLEEEIREEVAEIVGRRLKDPRIGFVTVTRVSLTADLRSARVHVGILGDSAQRERSLRGLKQAAGFVRRELGKRVRMRYTPVIAFDYDPGIEATDRVARLLEEARATDTGVDDPDETAGGE